MRSLPLSAWLGLAALALGACARPAEPAGVGPEPAAVAPPPARAEVPAVPTPLLPADRRLELAGATSAAPAAGAAPDGGKATFGAPITATQAVALADIAKDPKAFKGKTIVTTGTVSAVCQERGCWMEISDRSLDANVRMHGHSFFVPKTSSGKKARVQGTVMLMKDGKECEEMKATGATLELDATGVELI